MAVRIAAKSTTAGTPVKSWRRTRAGLKGISTDCSEVVFQLRIVSISAAKKDRIKRNSIALTLHVEVVTVSDCGFKEHSDRVGKFLVTLISEGWEREVLVGSVVDSEVVDLVLSVRMSCFDH